MKRVCYFGILKEGTDFRHLNMCIAKTNLAYSLLKDTFALLGSFQCKIMSVLNLNNVFHSLRLTENLKKYCRILPYFGGSSSCIKGCLWVSTSLLLFGSPTLMQY